MDYYDSDENLDEYEEMARGIDRRALVGRLAEWLPQGAAVLELGMGPGRDLELLAERYRVTGSDRSRLFLERYRRRRPAADLLELDAETLETERRFDGIFSNKVLHHLGPEELARSFAAQARILSPGGVALHSFWHGDTTLRTNGLLFQHYTESVLRSAVPAAFEWLVSEPYTEVFAEDSLLVGLRRSDDQ